MARPTGNPTKPIPVRFTKQLLAQIKEAAELMPGYSAVDIIRLCTEIGLVRLRRINYRVAEVLDAGTGRYGMEDSLRVAEDEPKSARGGKKE
jgi:hypothetical protein